MSLGRVLRDWVSGVSSTRSVGATDLVYVNQDGSARELMADEREYLSQEFGPHARDRPYVKSGYKSLDGWGSLSGFLPRNKVPRGVAIEPVNPDYVPVARNAFSESIEDSRRAGDIVVENADGSISTTPNPNLSTKQRFELLRQLQLERQRGHENRARVLRPGDTGGSR